LALLGIGFFTGGYRALASAVLLAIVLALTGCSNQSFDIKGIAKTDIDLVADLHRDETRRLVLSLATKLYKRNPRELRKQPGATLESRLQQLQQTPDLKFAELQGRQGIAAMDLAFQWDFRGDRVFALIVGLSGMLREAYGYKDEFFVLDELDQQKLYISARNIEVLVWRLKQSKDNRGKPLIYTNATGEVLNLSFERLFGKLIAHQDMLAQIMAGKTQRAINSVAHSIVSMTFMPL
jgi:hypothetical protein